MPAGVVARSTTEASLIAVPSLRLDRHHAPLPCGASTSIDRPGHAQPPPGVQLRPAARRLPPPSPRTSLPAPSAAPAPDRRPTAPTAGPPAPRPARRRGRRAGGSAPPAAPATRRAGRGSRQRRRLRAGVDDHRPAGLAGGQHSASPWPTSHATIAQPGGGQPGAITRIGTSTTSNPASSRADQHPQPPAPQRRHQQQRAHATASSSPPRHPVRPRRSPRRAPRRVPVRPGSASRPPGRRAEPARSRQPRHHAARPPPPARPSTVAGATTGAASRFASTATRLTWPAIPATTGAVTRCAAAGTASASASPRGTPAAGQPVGPAAARAARARRWPAPTARTRSSTAIAGIPQHQHHHGGAERGQRGPLRARWPGPAARPRPSPPRAARSAPARRAPRTRPAPPSPRRPRPAARPAAARSSNSTATHTIARLVPLTRQQMGQPGGLELVARPAWASRSVSPTTSPGRQPGGLRVEHGRGVPQPGPQRLRDPLPHRRLGRPPPAAHAPAARRRSAHPSRRARAAP